jgi:hypothetical protein
MRAHSSWLIARDSWLMALTSYELRVTSYELRAKGTWLRVQGNEGRMQHVEGMIIITPRLRNTNKISVILKMLLLHQLIPAVYEYPVK